VNIRYRFFLSLLLKIVYDTAGHKNLIYISQLAPLTPLLRGGHDFKFNMAAGIFYSITASVNAYPSPLRIGNRPNNNKIKHATRKFYIYRNFPCLT